MIQAPLLRHYMTLCESETISLPDDVIEAFEQLGDLQRGKPENAMLRVQHIMGGGVLNPVVEHVGDITHRMSHMVRHGTVLGGEKIAKTLRWLTHPYGFEREMRENIVNNARARGVPAAQLKQQVTEALRAYAKAHAVLPVYNKAQWLARQAAIDIGLEDFDGARACLSMLAGMSKTEEEFAEHAMQYQKSADGRLLPYSPG